MNPIKGWLADAEKSPDTRHVDTCDGVRALAICIVAWYHIPIFMKLLFAPYSHNSLIVCHP